MITNKGLKKEFIKRKEALLAASPIVLKGDFPQQDAFINDPSKYIAVQCSRRAGKTNGLAYRFLKTMEKHPKSQCLYLSLTQESARAIMWDIMHELNDRYSIGCTFLESKLEIKHPNGSRLKLMGADLKDYKRKLKGRKFPGVAIDEAQDFTSEQLQGLLNDSLGPSIADYSDGWIAITGTPGPVPQGYFFDVTNNKKYGYSHHAWTMLENPHMPDPEAFIKDLMAKREWDESNPTLLREYRNKWVLDVDALWIKYTASANHYTELPKEHKWNYVMGVDIGFNDADAIAVLAWSETSKETYLVEEIITNKQGVTALTTQIDAIQKKYGASKILLDEGGLGKKLAEDLRQRFGCPLEAADKANKQTNVELLNDSMRLGKFKAKSASRFAQDSYLIQIDWDKSTPQKIIIKKKPHSDIIDAVLYAFRDTYGYSYQEPKKGPKYGSKEWAEAQVSDMFEAEREGLMQENAEFNRTYGIFED